MRFLPKLSSKLIFSSIILALSTSLTFAQGKVTPLPEPVPSPKPVNPIRPIRPIEPVRPIQPGIIMRVPEASKDSIKLSELSVNVSVVGNVATTTCDMIFTNSSSRVLEGEFEFPLGQGQTIVVDQVVKSLRDLDFHEVDYVYEPGQFALRGSILDVYSFSSEYPFRIDFFGDDIDSIRTFEVDDQLSRDKRSEVTLVSSAATESQQ